MVRRLPQQAQAGEAVAAERPEVERVADAALEPQVPAAGERAALPVRHRQVRSSCRTPS